MNTIFINLIAWREMLAKKRFLSDILWMLLSLGVGSSLCEISLMILDQRYWQTHQKTWATQQKINHQHNAWIKATRIQNQLNKLSLTLQKQKASQESFQKMGEIFQQLANQADNFIQFKNIQCEKTYCLIEGESDHPNAIQNYQKNIQAIGYSAELSAWDVNDNQHVSFQLQVSH